MVHKVAFPIALIAGAVLAGVTLGVGLACIILSFAKKQAPQKKAPWPALGGIYSQNVPLKKGGGSRYYQC